MGMHCVHTVNSVQDAGGTRISPPNSCAGRAGTTLSGWVLVRAFGGLPEAQGLSFPSSRASPSSASSTGGIGEGRGYRPRLKAPATFMDPGSVGWCLLVGATKPAKRDLSVVHTFSTQRLRASPGVFRFWSLQCNERRTHVLCVTGGKIIICHLYSVHHTATRSHTPPKSRSNTKYTRHRRGATARARPRTTAGGLLGGHD